jgi:glycosyltransferase involved in cell wall biosynthesis
VRRLLLVTHRPIDQPGGGSARWRSLARLLPGEGWTVEVVAAPVRAGGVEFATSAEDLRRARLRARVMGRLAGAADPVARLLGARPDAFVPSTAWAVRGGAAVRRAIRAGSYDAVLATGPPIAGPLAARLGAAGPPLAVELRDLWAGSPAFDRGGPLLPAVEGWVLRRAGAVVAVTPEAADDLSARHPSLAGRVVTIPNGFDPALLDRRAPPPARAGRPLSLIHSGTLSVDRPLAPLLRVLERAQFRDAVRLVLHGHLAPRIAGEVESAGVPVEVVPPSEWDEAIRRVAAADAALVTQASGAGDATAVAAKAYEYLALGRPVLAITHGGATEGLLRRLGEDRYLARLDDEESIARALGELLDGSPYEPIDPVRLEPYSRRRIATDMARLLDRLAAGEPPGRAGAAP